jgi:tRNA(fMet)-specific endonuclease VapC
MKCLLDTNAWIHVLNHPAGAVAARLARQQPADVFLCSVVLSELLFGAYTSTRQAANLALVALLQQQFASLAFDDAAADHYARIRAHLEALGTPIGPYDMQSAGIALNHGLVVVTQNTAEFSRVPGLHLEDRTVP